MVKRHRSLIAGGAAGLILLAVCFLAVLGPATPAQAQSDISGDWAVQLSGDIPTSCDLRFEQSGGTLDVNGTCSEFGPASFSGTIDPSGNFVLSGPVSIATVDIEGTHSSDDDTISGTWNAAGIFSGTFAGTRGIQPPSRTRRSSQT